MHPSIDPSINRSIHQSIHPPTMPPILALGSSYPIAIQARILSHRIWSAERSSLCSSLTAAICAKPIRDNKTNGFHKGSDGLTRSLDRASHAEDNSCYFSERKRLYTPFLKTSHLEADCQRRWSSTPTPQCSSRVS